MMEKGPADIQPTSSRSVDTAKNLMSAFGFDTEGNEAGEAPEAPPQQAPQAAKQHAPEHAPEPQAEAEPEQPPQEAAEPATEGDPESAPPKEGEQKTEAGGDADEEDGEPVRSLSDLAEHLEVEPDYLMGLETEVTVDGERRTVPLSDLIRGYQTQQSLTQKGQSLAEQRKAYEAEQQQRNQQLEMVHAQAAAAIHMQEQTLQQEEERIKALREDEPERYAAEMTDLQARKQQFQQAKQNAIQAYQYQQYQQAQQAQQAHAQILQKEQQAVLDKVFPEWKDPQKAEQGRKAVKDYLATTYGLSQEEVGAIADHRVLDVVRKAMAYDKGLSASKVAEKKVAKVLKHPARRSARTTPQETQQSAREARMSNLKKSAKSGSRKTNHAAALDYFKNSDIVQGLLD